MEIIFCYSMDLEKCFVKRAEKEISLMNDVLEKQSDRKIDLDENTFQEAEIAVMNIYTRHLIEKVDKINLE